MYNFRVTNRGCDCTTYTLRDAKNKITYEFTATYSLDDNMLTTITMRVENQSRQTLSFDQGRVRVSSKRFAYRYNDKFIPFDPIEIKPGEAREITLVGQAPAEVRDEWSLIAGEQMTVTIRGVRLGNEELHVEDVHFVPINPKFETD
jgi:hypothetical protein